MLLVESLIHVVTIFLFMSICLVLNLLLGGPIVSQLLIFVLCITFGAVFVASFSQSIYLEEILVFGCTILVELLGIVILCDFLYHIHPGFWSSLLSLNLLQKVCFICVILSFLLVYLVGKYRILIIVKNNTEGWKKTGFIWGSSKKHNGSEENVDESSTPLLKKQENEEIVPIDDVNVAQYVNSRLDNAYNKQQTPQSSESEIFTPLSTIKTPK